MTIGNNGAVSFARSLSVAGTATFTGGTNGQVAAVGLTPSVWAFTTASLPSSLDAAEWMTFNVPNPAGGLAFTTGDPRVMTFCLGMDGHPTIRAQNLDISAGATAVAGNLSVSGALTLNSAALNAPQNLNILTNASSNPFQINSGNQATGAVALLFRGN